MNNGLDTERYDHGTVWLRSRYGTVTIAVRCGYDHGTVWLRSRYGVVTITVRCGYDHGTETHTDTVRFAAVANIFTVQHDLDD